MDKPLILHATTGMHPGGAERVLAMVATDPALSGFRHAVFSLLSEGRIALELKSMGIEVWSANVSQSGAGVTNIVPLISRARSLRPALIQGWMYHGNLLASVLGMCCGAPVVWGIHHTTQPVRAPLKARLTIGASTIASWLSPRKIVYCSHSAQQVHTARRFSSRGCVISNGIDTQRYCPSPEKRAAMRAQLGIPEESFAIGTVGRFAAPKDYLTLLKAAREMRRTRTSRKMSIVFCGTDLSWENPALANWIRMLELTDDVILLGAREDIPDVLNALDVFTMSSCGEALPLALLEAMASAVPCAVTDVGDCAAVVGDRTLAVPPGEPALLCAAWRKLEAFGQAARLEIGVQGRQRVIDRWGRDRMAGEYRNLYEDLMSPDEGVLKWVPYGR